MCVWRSRSGGSQSRSAQHSGSPKLGRSGLREAEVALAALESGEMRTAVSPQDRYWQFRQKPDSGHLLKA